MKEPRRWLDPAGGAGDLTRELLACAGDVEPPPSAKDAVWAGMVAAGVITAVASSATAAASGAAITGTATATATAAATGTIAAGTAASGAVLTAKMLLIGAVIAAGSVGGAMVLTQVQSAPREVTLELPATSALPPAAVPSAAAAPPRPAEASAAPDASSASLAADARPLPHPAGAANPAPTGAEELYAEDASDAPAPVVDETSASAGASAIVEEARLLRRARQALRAHEPARALALVAEAQRRFPHGRMTQEAEAIAIEALARSGARAEAKRRLEAFEREHPGSAHVDGLRDELR